MTPSPVRWDKGGALVRKVRLYIAASLDGFIAGPGGEIDWLDAGGDADYGYAAFYASIDTTLMGNETYKQVLTFGAFPYPTKTNYVFTRGAPPPDTAHVRFVSGDIAGFVRDLKEAPGADIWLVGGGQLNTIMLEAGLIDEIILTSFPLVLGWGIPLFAPSDVRSPFKTVGCQAFDTGLIQWRLVKP